MVLIFSIKSFFSFNKNISQNVKTIPQTDTISPPVDHPANLLIYILAQEVLSTVTSERANKHELAVWSGFPATNLQYHTSE